MRTPFFAHVYSVGCVGGGTGSPDRAKCEVPGEAVWERELMVTVLDILLRNQEGVTLL